MSLSIPRVVLSILIAAPLFGACKKAAPAPTRACVLSDSDGVRQCFEWTNAKPRAQQEQDCSEFEVFPGGKKQLVDSACPAAGQLGRCTLAPTETSVCYAAVDSCAKGCPGVFVRN